MSSEFAASSPPPARAQCNSRPERIFGWVLSGSEDVPGARINGLNLHRQMLRTGIRSVIVRQPNGYVEHLLPNEPEAILDQCEREGVNVLILQKVNGPAALRLVQRAKLHGIATTFIACDSVDNALAGASDAVFAVSGYLRDLFSRRHRPRIEILDDAIEVPGKFKHSPLAIPDEGRLRAVFISSSRPDRNIDNLLDVCAESVDVTIIAPPARLSSDALPDSQQPSPAPRSVDSIQQLREALSRYGVDVVPRIWRRAHYRIGVRPIAPIAPRASHRFVEWKLSTVFDVIAEHHIGLIPIHLDSDFKMAKSANRLAMFMAMGMPSIVSPLPAYVHHVSADRGLVARTPEQWREAISVLAHNRGRARQIGRRGHEYAWSQFSIEAVTARLLAGIANAIGSQG